MYQLKDANLTYALDDRASHASLVSGVSGDESMCLPGHIWKMIYAIPGTETVEATIWADDQTPAITCTEKEITLFYDGLVTDHKHHVDAKLTIHLEMAE